MSHFKENNSDKEVVFCVGMNRTGTRTFDSCIKTLGYTGSHWGSSKHLCPAWVSKSWDEFFMFVVNSRFTAFSDAPWCFPDLYIYLYEYFPKAKFVLTIREDDAWVNSYKNLYERHIENIKDMEVLPLISNIEEYGWIHPILFNGCTKISGNEETYKKVYNKHNNDVINFFKNKPNKLLLLDWKKDGSKGFEALCAFLNREVIKDFSVPHIKDTRKLYE